MVMAVKQCLRFGNHTIVSAVISNMSSLLKKLYFLIGALLNSLQKQGPRTSFQVVVLAGFFALTVYIPNGNYLTNFVHGGPKMH